MLPHEFCSCLNHLDISIQVCSSSGKYHHASFKIDKEHWSGHSKTKIAGNENWFWMTRYNIRAGNYLQMNKCTRGPSWEHIYKIGLTRFEISLSVQGTVQITFYKTEKNAFSISKGDYWFAHYSIHQLNVHSSQILSSTWEQVKHKKEDKTNIQSVLENRQENAYVPL